MFGDELTHPQPSVNYSGAMAYELRYQGSDAVFLIRDDQASAEFIEVMDELADYLTVSPVEWIPDKPGIILGMSSLGAREWSGTAQVLLKKRAMD